MCGIIGCSVSKNTSIQNQVFNESFEQLIHRGPDFQQIEDCNNKFSNIKIGFCRLSIQDLSDNANRIFTDNDNALLFNGEIYNYRELKIKYFNKEKFETNSDTELLFKFIKKFKFNKINELNGIFALAWVDNRENKITLARDYTGVKTLYYVHQNKNFYFCSEAWYLYKITHNKKINFDALNFYLRFGFNDIEKCIQKDIFKVRPGEIIQYEINKNLVNKIQFHNKNSINISDKDINHDLEEAVKLNLVSDTKIGLFISGGLDSSIIATLAKKNNNFIEAYTNTYDESKHYIYNEDYEYSKEICKNLNIKLFSNHIIINEQERNDFLKALDFFDEPLANLNIFNSFKQAKFAKQNGVKVILTGDGADEIFGGYDKYCKTKIYQHFSFLSLFSKKIRKYKNYNKNFFPLLFFEKLNSEDMKNFLNKDIFNEIINSESHHFKLQNGDLNETINSFDFKYWMTSDHNFKLDRTLMANSIEGRVPYQDINLINKYYNIKISDKVNFFKTKIQLRKNTILRKKFRNRLKQGWHLPEKWFVNKMIKPVFFDYLNENKFLNKIEIEKLFNEKYYKKIPIYKIITIFMLMHWNKKSKLI